MDVRLVERLGRHASSYDTTIGHGHHRSRSSSADFDAIAITAGAMDAVALDIPGADLEGVDYGVDFMKKANLGQPLEVGTRRRRHRRRLHRDGLLADEPAPRRGARHDRLPPDALRARRRRGGAGRDGARGRPHGVPRQPDRGPRRGRQGRRRQVHPQPPRRAGRVRPPLAGADRGLRVRHPGPDRHPGRVAGRRPDVPAGRGDASRSTAAGSRWTPRPTPRTSGACSPAATS